LRHKIVLALFLGTLMISACSDVSSLRSSYPIKPVRDYETFLVGDLEANYIGDENCLAKCHTHDKLSKDFKLSIHGDQISAETGLPLVNCESCHGPGSKAVEEVESNQPCNFNTLLPLSEFPAPAQAILCLKCHSAASTPNLTNWNSSIHAINEVSCFSCHQLHKGPQQKLGRDEQYDVCVGCHVNIKMQFAQFSHHPAPEHKMVCTDCHDPHNSTNSTNLKGFQIKAVCTKCHMDKQGPFVYEHADVTEDCTTCHSPHGSPNNMLLTVSQPFLCLQCHAGHNSESMATGALDHIERKQVFYNRCTDCHSAVHGTDIPGRGLKAGSFTR